MHYVVPVYNAEVMVIQRVNLFILECYFNTEAKAKERICLPYDLSSCVHASKLTKQNVATLATPSNSHNFSILITKTDVSKSVVT